MYKIGIVLNGEVTSKVGFHYLTKKLDYIIAADGGNNHLYALQILPNFWVGDLDSIHAQSKAWLEAANIPGLQFPVAKDSTDADLAVTQAEKIIEEKKLQPQEVELYFLASFGQRFDHVLANQCMAVKLARRGYRVYLSDGLNFTYIFHDKVQEKIAWPPQELKTLDCYSKQDQDPIFLLSKWTFSAIAISEKVLGLSYQNALYPLENAALEFGSTLGVSNKNKENHTVLVQLEMKQGDLIFMIVPEI